MKDTEYGLNAAVYSADQKRAENILQQINAGTGYWNCCDRVECSIAMEWKKTFRIRSYTLSCRFTCIYKTKSLSFAQLIIADPFTITTINFFEGLIGQRESI
jgi:hypothetical protein